MEEETIEVTFNSKSIQLKIKKNCSTGLTDALASVHPTFGGSSDAPVGLSPLDASWNQVKSLYITGWTDGPKQSTGVLDILCSREHVWWTSTRLQHWLIRRFKNYHRCIRCTMFQRACLSWSENLFSTGWTDAPTEHAPVQWRKPGYCVKTPNGYYLDTERPVEPTPSHSNPSVLPMVTIFLQ